VKKSEGKQVEGIFGFGKKDKDKSKVYSTQTREVLIFNIS